MSKARNLADLLSDGAELADGQISVAEVVGAAPLASPTFTGTASGTFSGPLTGNVTGNLTGSVTGAVTGDVTAPEIDLSAISATISDTAVDIFVYDTGKDSDGGAWRKRTQHTSWYNETLSTSTRGSRKEFPAVAVIVGTADDLFIYDGDDPDLPLWMKFADGTGNLYWMGTGGVSALSMKNGQLISGNDGGTRECNFITEFMMQRRSSSSQTKIYYGDIAGRNGSVSRITAPTNTSQLIVNDTINDVAMTVLPNAPIDAATGLPVPTIAVATGGGVSVINDDGTVADSAEANTCTNVLFDLDGNLYRELGNHYQIAYNSVESYKTDSFSRTGLWTDDAVYDATTSDFKALAYGKYKLLSSTNQGGFHKTELSAPRTVTSAPSSLSSKYLVNRTTSSYNTGWQNGDIKLATLSDTDATNVTGSELVTNGTFDSDTSGWTTTNFTQSSGVITSSTAGSQADQTITTVSGKTYTISFDITANHTDAQNGVYIRNSDGSSYADFRHSNETGSFSGTFTATGSSMIVRLYNGSTVGTISFDNVSVRLAEEDRSVNGNGLQVFGTVTKSAVASGADLVAYSGFSTSNYLEQPYNSDLDFGTGDFSLMGWAKPTGFIANQHGHIFARQDPESANEWALQYLTTNDLAFRSAGGTIAGAGALTASVWSNFCVVRASGTLYIYINGVLKTSAAFTGNISNAADATPLRVGGRSAAYAGSWGGSLALLRISATAPSAEQIKKIYEDEKVLFQENAKATLYGSSDAVTALAYDDATELLHVGTSAGRSVFQGLRRVDNTTDAVSAAISASNGLVAED